MVIEVKDFQGQVLDESRQRPVLVDFWAPWCGPCRQLGPLLEKLASEPDAAFVLAKLNTDEDPTTAGRYDIKSIPAVKLFVDGEVVDEFIGALPEAQVRRWLENALPNGTKTQIEEAQRLIAAGQSDEAGEVLEAVLAAEPQNTAATAMLARLLAFDDPELAVQLAGIAAQDATNYDLSRAMNKLAELLRDESAAGLPDEPAKQHYIEGIEALASKDVDKALSSLVQSVRVNAKYANGAARNAAVAVLTVLGKEDPLVKKHRRALEMALF